ncbi:TolC family outer membrane protein [Permianibacter sp. IMCC34836]|uniref:TolC family outer membrane protein n=1 Tax=Permianibacter fluminis TaxID=2738515 RepID=UPI0015558F09|nr:TolC family outer membrane protein [Permianibacter fluminis]NQD36646.1 TolC family outer membrane protein [Permianibacter fluminis]
MFKRTLSQTLTPVAATVALLISSAGHAENLIDVYRAALQNDPQFLASEARANAAKEGVTIARSVLLPQISGTVSKSKIDSRTESSPISPNDDDSDTNRDVVSLRLDQQLYHHDSWVGLSQAEKRSTQAELAFKAELQGLVVRSAEAYFNVLSAQDGVQLAQSELESIGKQLEQTKQRFNVGLIAITDVHEAQARYDQAQANMISAQNTLDNANESLRQITSAYYASINRLKTDLPLTSPDPASADDWVKVAQESNLSLKAQRLAAEVAHDEVKRQRAGHYPTLDLSASYTDTDSDGDRTALLTDTTSPFDNSNETKSIGVTLSVPIFSGFRTSASTDQASANYVVAAQDMEKQHRQTVRDARSAYLGLQAAISSVKALTQAEISAQSALEATQAGFEVGTRTIVDVLQATSNLYQAKRNLWRARYDYALNVLRLKAAAGTLVEDDLVKVNSWLE